TLTGDVTSSSTNYFGIVFSGAAASFATISQSGSNNTIAGCTITGGYTGISLYGNTDSTVAGNTITGNTITDFYASGIDLYRAYHTEVTDNSISQPARTATNNIVHGITLNTLGFSNEIARNRIHDLGNNTALTYKYGILITADADA